MKVPSTTVDASEIRLTTKDDDYPIIYRVLTIPGGAGFLPTMEFIRFVLVNHDDFNFFPLHLAHFLMTLSFSRF